MTAAPDRSASVAAPQPAEWGIPTRWSAAVFQAKTAIYQLQRSIRDLAAGPQFCPSRMIIGSQSPLGHPKPRCGRRNGRRNAPTSWGRCRICGVRPPLWTGSSCRRARSSASGSKSDARADGAALSPAGCCSRGAWFQRPAAAYASSQTRFMTRPCRPNAKSSNGMRTLGSSQARLRLPVAMRRWRGITSICDSGRARRYGSMLG
jgi:hypothetical protein